MEEGFTVRSGLVVIAVILAVQCAPTEQRPLCASGAGCGSRVLGLAESHPRSLNSKYLSAGEESTAIKELMEMLLMQHNEFAETNRIGGEDGDEENSTERPPTGGSLIEFVPRFNATVGRAEESSTERPPKTEGKHPAAIDANSIESHEVKSTEKHAVEGTTARVPTKDIAAITHNKHNESFWEVTTMPPQQLASPLGMDEYQFEVTTLPPDMRDISIGQVDVASKQKNNITSHQLLLNIPPTRQHNKKKNKRTTTKSPQRIVRPPQIETFTEPPPLLGHVKNKITTAADKNSSVVVPAGQDVRNEAQSELLNRPISTSKPLTTTATPGVAAVSGANATSKRPNKKPINIIPESIVRKGQKPAAVVAGKPQGPGGLHNPISSSTPSETDDDYLISALASIVDGGDEDDDEVDGDGGGEVAENSEEDDEYLVDSGEDTEERENFDYVDSDDASDVISSVIEEVGALL